MLGVGRKENSDEIPKMYECQPIRVQDSLGLLTTGQLEQLPWHFPIRPWHVTSGHHIIAYCQCNSAVSYTAYSTLILATHIHYTCSIITSLS
jgi:hypothetical protein